jgi:hypothetical protein
MIELVSGIKMRVQHPKAVVTHAGSAVFFASDGAITLFEANSVSRLADATATARR